MNHRIYGYCRISTASQNIERQVRNIKAAYPDAEIKREVYTGTKFGGRQELERLLKKVSCGDTIVFDSVSRFSRNAVEGFELYEKLYHQGISLVFLKEPHINTDTYQKALNVRIEMTGTNADVLLSAVKKYLLLIAKEQIKLAFDQAQKEVDDLHQRTKEGMLTAKMNGKQIGQQPGRRLNVRKAARAQKIILQHSKDFGGTLRDCDVIRLAGISAKTYYKYKKQLKQERDEI